MASATLYSQSLEEVRESSQPIWFVGPSSQTTSATTLVVPSHCNCSVHLTPRGTCATLSIFQVSMSSPIAEQRLPLMHGHEKKQSFSTWSTRIQSAAPKLLQVTEQLNINDILATCRFKLMAQFKVTQFQKTPRAGGRDKPTRRGENPTNPQQRRESNPKRSGDPESTDGPIVNDAAEQGITECSRPSPTQLVRVRLSNQS